ncbi:MAG: hypothetical protein M0T84_18275 [Betaproteobacteria bacterium]|nr:hypothetical protein [Betaproteobacteria bacterium]
MSWKTRLVLVSTASLMWATGAAAASPTDGARTAPSSSGAPMVQGSPAADQPSPSRAQIEKMISAQQDKISQDQRQLRRLYRLKNRQLYIDRGEMLRALAQQTRVEWSERFCIAQAQNKAQLKRCRIPFNPLIMRMAHTGDHSGNQALSDDPAQGFFRSLNRPMPPR